MIGGIAVARENYHSIVMAVRPICEPVELPLGASVIAERVTVAADSPRIGRFMHFHDVAELVLFRHVRGEFVADGRRHPIADGAVVFVPSMRHHDFALEPGRMEWVLVQLDPYLVGELALHPAMARLARPFCAWPDAAGRARLDALADWLIEATTRDPAGPAVARIVELLLLAAVEAPEGEAGDEPERTDQVGRLLPVLEWMRGAPSEPISLHQAASMCSLSPTYFSRRFRQVLGMPFNEYLRVHRLHLAARRIVATDAALSDIAYGVGFSSPSHFTARFRERFGMTPRDYRASARGRARA